MLTSLLSVPAPIPTGSNGKIIFVVLIVILGLILILRRRGKSKREEKEIHQEIFKVVGEKLNVIFKVTGWQHLTGEAARIQRNVEVGDFVKLEDNPENEHDNLAIKVIKEGHQIGWYGAESPKKKEVWILISTNKKIKAEVIGTFPTEVEVTYDPAEQTEDNTIPFDDNSEKRV